MQSISTSNLNSKIKLLRKIINFLKDSLLTRNTFLQIGKNENQPKIILDILISFSIMAFLIINTIRVIDSLTYSENSGLPLWVTMSILLFFFFLAFLSRRQKIKSASILILIIYAIPTVFCLVIWGADLPAGLLLSVLIITMSAALLKARFAFVITLFFIMLMITLTYLQNTGIIAVQDYWRQETSQIGDAIAYSIIILIIAGIAWLFAHGLKQSLRRANLSEEALKIERDSLEIKVTERTEELRRAELEKMNQLARLAKLGKLSSGIFHDLINPLTAVSLNLEQIKEDSEHESLTEEDIERTKIYLNQAILAAHKMDSLINGVKKQIRKEGSLSTFSPVKEINEIIQILAYKARQADVEINLINEELPMLYGDAVKFGQIIINLLANAIDASEKSENAQKIIINLKQCNTDILITIKDYGIGIAEENLNKIFERFFSTKKESGQGIGIGLSLTKALVEDSFSGNIQVASQLGKGTVFTILFPLKHPAHEI